MSGRLRWLTPRRLAAIALVQVVILGFVGGVFVHFYGFSTPSDDSSGYVETLNVGNRSVDVSLVLVDVRTDSPVFEATYTLGAYGKDGDYNEDGHYSMDWPSMPPGEKRLTVSVEGNRSGSYEFDAGEDGDGPNLSITIDEDEIEFSLEPSGM